MHARYVFGPFVIDPAQRVLLRNSAEPVAIHARAFDALVYLIRHAGEIVPRAALMKALWPTTIVEDNNLSQTLRALRQALGDTGPRYRYIATVPRRGYQFVAAVAERNDVDRAPAIRRNGLRFAAAAAAGALAPGIALAIVAFFTSAPSPAPLHAAAIQKDWPHLACAEPLDTQRCAIALQAARVAAHRRKLGLQEI